jgi:ssDNA-binding replication factor A large subunit
MIRQNYFLRGKTFELVDHVLGRGESLSPAGRVCLRDVHKVKISDIKDGDNEINVEGEVTEKSYAREVRSRYGRVLMVADATLKDETGRITLTLWNEQVKQVMVGDKVKIENGYAKSFRNVLQLSTGKYGKLTVI